MKFLGRICGLGNRVEEIIKLEAYSNQVNEKITYCWNKQYIDTNPPNRDVVSSVRIKSNRIDIVDSYTNDGFIDEKIPNIKGEEIKIAARQLFPDFNIEIPENTIAVHLRSTDRIGGGSHPHFMNSIKEYNDYFNYAVNKVLELNPKNCFICGDSDNEILKFYDRISNKINIVQPVCDSTVDDQWKDFFFISKCDGVVLATKFSSFSISAAMIGGIPIWARYINNEYIQERYPNDWRI